MTEPDRETVVVTEGGGGGGGGLIVAIVIGILLVIGVIYFVNMNSGGEGGTVSVDVPAVDVSE